MDTPVTLVGTPISHYVQTVILCCEEKGVPYQLQVDGHDSPAALVRAEHRRWHPFGKIPALSHEGIKLYETSAICRYIDLRFEGAGLVPRLPARAALMEQWISSFNSYFHRPCISQLVGQYVFPRGPQGRPDPVPIAEAIAEINVALEPLENACRVSSYLAGNALSLADLFAGPILLQMSRTSEGKELLAQHRSILDYSDRLAARPSFARAQALFEQYLPAGHCLESDPASGS